MLFGILISLQRDTYSNTYNGCNQIFTSMNSLDPNRESKFNAE